MGSFLWFSARILGTVNRSGHEEPPFALRMQWTMNLRIAR